LGDLPENWWFSEKFSNALGDFTALQENVAGDICIYTAGSPALFGIPAIGDVRFENYERIHLQPRSDALIIYLYATTTEATPSNKICMTRRQATISCTLNMMAPIFPAQKQTVMIQSHFEQEPLRRDLWREFVFSRRGGDRGAVVRRQGSLQLEARGQFEVGSLLSSNRFKDLLAREPWVTREKQPINLRFDDFN
jgi:hypothetical protein